MTMHWRDLFSGNARHAAAARMAAWPVLVVVLTALVLTLVAAWFIHDQMRDAAAGRVERRAAAGAQRISMFLGARSGELELLARSPLWRGAPVGDAAAVAASAGQRRAELDWLRQRQPAYVWLAWVDARGSVATATGGWLEGRSIAEWPVFRQARSGPFFGDDLTAVALTAEAGTGGAGAPASNRAPGWPTELVDVAVPVFDPSGALLGVLAAHLDAASVVRAVRAGQLRAFEDDPLVQVVVGTPPRVLAAGANALPLSAALAAAAGTELRWLPDEGGARHAVAAAGLQGAVAKYLPWRVMASISDRRVLEEAWGWVSLAAGIGLLAAILSALVAWRGSRHLLQAWSPLFDAMAQRYAAQGGAATMPWASFVDEVGHMLEHGQGTRKGSAAPGATAPAGTVVTEVAAPTADTPRALPLAEPPSLFERLAYDAWQLKQVIDQLPLGIAVAGPDLHMLYVNPAHVQMFGWSSEELLGEPLDLCTVLPADLPAQIQLLAQLQVHPAAVALRSGARRRDGRLLTIEWQVTPLLSSDGQLVGFLSQVRDITTEQRALRKVAEDGHRLRLFTDAAQDLALVMLDAEGRVVDWSDGARRMKGYDAAQALGLPLAQFFCPEDVAAGVPQRVLAQARATGRTMLEGWHVRADGSRFWSRGFLYTLPVEAAPARFAMFTRDMTGPHTAGLRLAEQRAALQGLTQRLLVQEKETTRRLALTLHDELGQTLVALRLNADLVLDRLAPGIDGQSLLGGREVSAKHVARLDQLITLANAQVRTVLSELRPPLIDERGLWAALDNELQRGVPAAGEVVLTLVADPQLELLRWPSDVEYAAFMVAREAVFNAVRHAHASAVRVLMEGDGRRLSLTVSDDGVGLPEDALDTKPGHLGLVGMHERAEAIGARLTLRTVPGQGTLVVVTWSAESGPGPGPEPDPDPEPTGGIVETTQPDARNAL